MGKLIAKVSNGDGESLTSKDVKASLSPLTEKSKKYANSYGRKITWD